MHRVGSQTQAQLRDAFDVMYDSDAYWVAVGKPFGLRCKEEYYTDAPWRIVVRLSRHFNLKS